MIFGFLRKFRIDIEKNPHKNKNLRDQTIFAKKSKKYFSRPKKIEHFSYEKVNEKWTFQNFDFFSKFQKCEFPLTFQCFFSEFFLSRKNIFRMFFKIFFDFENVYFIFGENILKSEICSGIQKSYLENRTSIIKLFKLKNTFFFTSFGWFWWRVTYNCP